MNFLDPAYSIKVEVYCLTYSQVSVTPHYLTGCLRSPETRDAGLAGITGDKKKKKKKVQEWGQGSENEMVDVHTLVRIAS